MLDRYTPKVIVLEVTPYDMCVSQGDYDRLSVLLPYAHHSSWLEIVTTKSPWEPYKCWSTVYPYNSIFLKMVKNLKNHGEFKQCGFQPLEGRWNHPIDDYTDNRSLDERKVKMMRDIIETYKAKNIKLLMVSSPMYAHAVHTATLQQTEDICQEFGIPYISFLNMEEYQNNALFHTMDHLNSTGAHQFSQEVAQWIKQNL